ncbi:unnamed protein product [Tilletia controversa]|nr:unnamed protein product [Tilletia controversa]
MVAPSPASSGPEASHTPASASSSASPNLQMAQHQHHHQQQQQQQYHSHPAYPHQAGADPSGRYLQQQQQQQQQQHAHHRQHSFQHAGPAALDGGQNHRMYGAESLDDPMSPYHFGSPTFAAGQHGQQQIGSVHHPQAHHYSQGLPQHQHMQQHHHHHPAESHMHDKESVRQHQAGMYAQSGASSSDQQHAVMLGNPSMMHHHAHAPQHMRMQQQQQHLHRQQHQYPHHQHPHQAHPSHLQHQMYAAQQQYMNAAGPCEHHMGRHARRHTGERAFPCQCGKGSYSRPPDGAYMGSTFYSTPHMPQHINRHHQGSPNVVHTSGSPHLGMPSTVNTPSPTGSSPQSVSPVTALAPEAEPLPVSFTSRRAKSSRASSNVDVRSGTGRTKPEASPNPAVVVPTQTVERSEHVMWVGNVPQDATVKELFEVFSKLPASDSAASSAKPDVTDAAEPSLPAHDETVDSSTRQSSESTDTKAAGDPDNEPDANVSRDRRPSSVRVVDTALVPPSDESTSAEQAAHGVISVFPISRSNCAFVNYATAEHLARAVTFFSGQPVRPQDKRCLPMICRVRKKDDEERAGVAGQRGRGMHVEWVKEHERKRRDAVAAARRGENAATEAVDTAVNVPSIELSVPTPSQTTSPAPVGNVLLGQALPTPDEYTTPSTTPRPQVISTSRGHAHDPSSSSLETSSMTSLSLTSTNSSVLRHPAFKVRYFILKSRTRDDLDLSVESGHWATQPHNEAVLDQAYRLSASVILILGANQSGEFYGYARMSGPVRPGPEASPASNSSGGSSGKLTSNASSPPGPPPVHTDSLLRGLAIMPEETDEAMSRASGAPATAESSVSAESSASDPLPLMPPDAFRACVASPLQLTPAEEDEPDVPPEYIVDTSEHPATWPSVLTDAAPRGDPLSRGATLSPKLLSQLHRPGLFRPEDIGLDTNPSPVVGADVQHHTAGRLESDHSVGIESGGSLVDEHAVDSEGPRTSDTGKELTNRPMVSSPNLSDHSSLGPADSASYDARAAQQLAMRAIIHNLRLDERESTRQAEELEQHLKISEGQSEDTGAGVIQDEQQAKVILPPTPKTDVLGQPFPITWLQTKPLPFRRIQHLRNPWRDNRQIKVSRDGTELEPSVGDQLVAEWERFVAEGGGGEGEGPSEPPAADVKGKARAAAGSERPRRAEAEN